MTRCHLFLRIFAALFRIAATSALASCIALADPPPPPCAAAPAAASPFNLKTDNTTGFVTSLRRTGDTDQVEFIRPGTQLGPVNLRFRQGTQAWQESAQDTSSLHLTSQVCPTEHSLHWIISIKNQCTEAVEIGDLSLPLPMNTDYSWDHQETFVHRLCRHSFIAGHGSFLYWLPAKGSGSFLVMIPEGDTSLEYFTSEQADYAFGRDRYAVFIHSKASSSLTPQGTWRQSPTSRLLQPNEVVRYAFQFVWADSYQAVRDLLHQRGGLNVQVAPGMVLPRDLSAHFALQTQHQVNRIEPEFPSETTIERLPERAAHTSTFKVTFARLGENRLLVHYADKRTMPLEFFVTEPLETLIKKRAAFITKNQQHRDPSKWYDGLYSLWDRRQPPDLNKLGPDHLGGQHPYAVSGSDDPSNSKCLLVAEKNVAFPDASEIASLEYFIKHFVWGKLQRTDAETPFPFGIYGSDSWKENRLTDRDPLNQGISRPGGPSACKMWRSFDYPTYFALYFNLYRIAKQRPDLIKEANATTYLARAFGTARAYFDVPAALRMEGGWTFTGWVYWQYTVGNFHEKYLLPLIAALEAEGQTDQANALRHEWEKKVKFFIYDSPWPFASEMPIDSTAYESTYAAARYALENPLCPDTNLWHDRNLHLSFSHPTIDPKRHEAFLQRQHLANLACRGVLETNYWSLGSDFRGCGSASYTLSYMSQMGGWAVLDYALRFDPEPAANLRLGYASMLSSWALMNSGDDHSNFGFWTPGPLHDGAMSWGFQPRQVGSEWNPATRDLPRGAWPICGEADHGLVAAIEAACTVLYDDPLFGVIAYGGEVHQDALTISAIPRDGVRQRFHAMLGSRRLHLALDRDGFAPEQTITVSRNLNELSFLLESRSPQTHQTWLTIEGLPEGPYLATAGSTKQSFRATSGQNVHLAIPVSSIASLPVGIKAAPCP